MSENISFGKWRIKKSDCSSLHVPKRANIRWQQPIQDQNTTVKMLIQDPMEPAAAPGSSTLFLIYFLIFFFSTQRGSSGLRPVFSLLLIFLDLFHSLIFIFRTKKCSIKEEDHKGPSEGTVPNLRNNSEQVSSIRG